MDIKREVKDFRLKRESGRKGKGLSGYQVISFRFNVIRYTFNVIRSTLKATITKK